MYSRRLYLVVSKMIYRDGDRHKLLLEMELSRKMHGGVTIVRYGCYNQRLCLCVCVCALKPCKRMGVRLYLLFMPNFAYISYSWESKAVFCSV